MLVISSNKIFMIICKQFIKKYNIFLFQVTKYIKLFINNFKVLH